jgi:tetratricopeptide (TPR) repeat protein
MNAILAPMRSNLAIIFTALQVCFLMIYISCMGAAGYMVRGVELQSAGKYDLAILEFDKALEQKSDNVSLYASILYHRGFSYDQQGNYEKALDDYSKSIDLEPSEAKVFHSRAQIYLKKKNYNGAIADLNRAIELEPKIARNYFERAEIEYNNLQKNKDAIADYQKAIELDKSRPDYFFKLGKLCALDSQYDLAIIFLGKGIDLDPGNAESFYFRGLSLAAKARQTEAAKDFETCLGVSKDADLIAGANRNLKRVKAEIPLREVVTGKKVPENSKFAGKDLEGVLLAIEVGSVYYAIGCNNPMFVEVRSSTRSDKEQWVLDECGTEFVFEISISGFTKFILLSREKYK